MANHCWITWNHRQGGSVGVKWCQSYLKNKLEVQRKCIKQNGCLCKTSSQCDIVHWLFVTLTVKYCFVILDKFAQAVCHCNCAIECFVIVDKFAAWKCAQVVCHCNCATECFVIIDKFAAWKCAQAVCHCNCFVIVDKFAVWKYVKVISVTNKWVIVSL